MFRRLVVFLLAFILTFSPITPLHLSKPTQAPISTYSHTALLSQKKTAFVTYRCKFCNYSSQSYAKTYKNVVKCATKKGIKTFKSSFIKKK